MKRVFIILSFLVFSFSGVLLTQEKKPVTLSAEVIPKNIKQGDKGVFIVTCSINPSFHISDASTGLFDVSPEPLEGVTFGEAEFPKGEKSTYGSIYRGKVKVRIPFMVKKEMKEGESTISVKVKIQPCAEGGDICYPPETQIVKAKFSVLPGDENTKPGVGELNTEGGGIAGRLSNALQRGSFIAFLLVFLGGLLTSLTPCVYPMIPITIAVIGAQASGGKFRGFVLSLFYVLGIAITFSSLGVIAAKTGALFGSYAQNPVALVIISIIFFLMGLSMLGLFVIQMPSSISSKLRGGRRRGFVGALVTGLLAGLIVSPCISPLLVVILTWVAKTGSVVLGIGLLFSFALGLGVLFIILGTFSGVIKNLPRSGGWAELIEKSFGVILLALAIVFLRSVVSHVFYLWLWAIFLVVLGTYTGAFTLLDGRTDGKKKFGKAFGIILILVGGSIIFWNTAHWVGFNFVNQSKVQQFSEENSYWLSSDEEGFREAKLTGKPVVMDFFAQWCAACHELDEKTWSQGSVRSELNRFVRVKLDLTKNDTNAKEFQKKYKILGMPTVIIFDSSGKEITRFEGFKSPQEVLALLKSIKSPDLID